MQQLRNVASLPFVHGHVAVMPDVHWGMGATAVMAAQSDLVDVVHTLRQVLCVKG
jgi:RNA-splicing ligase RtcB